MAKRPKPQLHPAPFPGGDGIPLSEPATATRPRTELSAIADPAQRLMVREMQSQTSLLRELVLHLKNVDRQSLTAVHRLDTLLARTPYVSVVVAPPAGDSEPS